jgi:hypothetical protein
MMGFGRDDPIASEALNPKPEILKGEDGRGGIDHGEKRAPLPTQGRGVGGMGWGGSARPIRESNEGLGGCKGVQGLLKMSACIILNR